MKKTSTNIQAALTFDYIETSQLMYPSNAKAIVRIYVEDEGDIMFWRNFFSPYEELYNFCISVYQCADRDLSGKDCIMKAIETEMLTLNSYMLTCVDADYDLLIDSYHSYTNTFRANPYIITTHWYSIENLQAATEHLTTYYYYTTLSKHCSIDFESIVKQISTAYYQLFIRLILCLSFDALRQHYTIEHFGNDLKEVVLDEKNNITQKTYDYINTQINILAPKIISHHQHLKKIIQKLQEIGIRQDNCFQMFKGHFWMDNIIIPLLNKLTEKPYQDMIRQKITGITNSDTRTSIVNHYNDNVGVRDENIDSRKSRIRRLIKDQIHNNDLDIAKSISADIENALKRDHITTIINSLVHQYTNTSK